MKQFLVAATIAAASLGSAWAEKGATYLAGGLGGFAISDDEVTLSNNQTTTNDIAVGFALNGKAGRFISQNVALEGELGIYSASWDGFDNGALEFVCESNAGCLDQQITNVSVTGNVVFSAPMTAKFRPYAGVGGGFFATSYNLEDVDNDFGFGVIAKVGADVAVSERTRVGLEYVYVGAPDVEFDDEFEFSVAGNSVLLTALVRF